MHAHPQAAPPQQTHPRKLFTPPVMLAAAFTVELFCSKMLPEADSMQYSWAGAVWHPTRWEWFFYVLMNVAIARAVAGLLTSDQAGRLSLMARRGVMLGGLFAAFFLGAQALYVWLVFTHEGGNYAGGPGLPGTMGHAAILFQGAVGFATLRWMGSRLATLGRAREAARARMARVALLIALAARALAFGTGTAAPAVALVIGLTAMLYVAHQLTLMERPTNLLLIDPPLEGEESPQL